MNRAGAVFGHPGIVGPHEPAKLSLSGAGPDIEPAVHRRGISAADELPSSEVLQRQCAQPLLIPASSPQMKCET
jgi:hypothetical protein